MSHYTIKELNSPKLNNGAVPYVVLENDVEISDTITYMTAARFVYDRIREGDTYQDWYESNGRKSQVDTCGIFKLDCRRRYGWT